MACLLCTILGVERHRVAWSSACLSVCLSRAACSLVCSLPDRVLWSGRWGASRQPPPSPSGSLAVVGPCEPSGLSSYVSSIHVVCCCCPATDTNRSCRHRRHQSSCTLHPAARFLLIVRAIPRLHLLACSAQLERTTRRLTSHIRHTHELPSCTVHVS